MGRSFQTYALRGTDIVYINDVESGLKCNCTCPGCGEPLIARKGPKRIHHFAHQSSACEYGYESSLHLAAKDILSKAKTLTLPPTYVLFPHTQKGADPTLDARTISIDYVELEKQFGSIVPDIVVCSNGKKLFVEIYVTHKIDEEKRKKIEDLGISTIEIDLSSIEKTVTREELSVLLQSDCPEKKWIYNVWAAKCLEKLLSYTEEKAITHRRYAVHVDDCPLHVRDYHGKAYANFIDDCIGCKYYFGENNSVIHCSGVTLVSTPQDLKLTFEERKARQAKDKLQQDLSQRIPLNRDYETEKKSNKPKNGNTEKPVNLKYTGVVSNQASETEKPDFKIEDFENQAPVIDDTGWRWMICTKCGSIMRVDKMYSKGTPGNINKGICRKCYSR